MAPEPPPDGWWQRVRWHALGAGATALASTVAYLWIPQTFLADDKRNQYLPVAMDIGRRLQAGEWLPTIDPDLGPSGNYALDIQYGLYDPSHWVVDLGLAHVSDLALAAFLWSLVFEVVLSLGVSVLAARLRVPLPWCAVAGVAAATSGWVYFHLALDWIPGLVSLAWVPWLWWAWLGGRDRPGGRARVRDCVAIAAFGWLVVAGGWPATWLLLAALWVGWLIETSVLRPRTSSLPTRAVLRGVVQRSLALGAGVTLGALTVLPLVRAAPETIRQHDVANTNFLTGNLADIVSFAAPQLHGDIMSFGGAHELGEPIYFVAWFAVVVLWTHRWSRDTWRLPGMATCLVAGSAMVLLTQGPSTLGPLRDEIRELAGVQLCFVVAVAVLAGAGPWVVTRLRLTGLGLTFAALLWLTFGRYPDGFRSIAGIVAEVVLAAGLLWLARRSVAWVALGALVSTVAMTILAFALYHGNGTSPDDAFGVHLTSGGLAVGADDEPMFVAAPEGDLAQWVAWQRSGAGRAFSDLSAIDRPSPGYSSVSQRAFTARFCILGPQGDGCPSELRRLFAVEPTTGRPWADLLGYRTVFVADGALEHSMQHLAPAGWQRTASEDGMNEWRRSGAIAVAGRVTRVVGAARVSAVRVDDESQSYQVSTGPGALLVFRDLFWPGYHATLDGRPIPVTTLDGTLVTVRLPPGAHGVLTLAYRPISALDVIGFAGLAALLLLAALVLVRSPRRSSRSS